MEQEEKKGEEHRSGEASRKKRSKAESFHSELPNQR